MMFMVAFLSRCHWSVRRHNGLMMLDIYLGHFQHPASNEKCRRGKMEGHSMCVRHIKVVTSHTFVCVERGD